MGFTFGTQPAAGTQPQTGFSFGQQNQTNAQAPATGGFSFGNNTAQQPAASKPLFGAPAQNTGFGTTTFGTKPAGSMFGNANSFGAAGTVKPGELIVRLSYVERNPSEPLISLITQKFGITLNIIFADVEIVQNAPIGGTVAIFSGDSGQIDAALTYLKEKNVGVEVIRQ